MAVCCAHYQRKKVDFIRFSEISKISRYIHDIYRGSGDDHTIANQHE